MKNTLRLKASDVEVSAPPRTVHADHPAVVDASINNLADMQAFVLSQIEQATRTGQQAGNETDMPEAVKSALGIIKSYVKTLNSSILLQHQEDQNETTGLLALIAECANEGEGEDGGVQSLLSAMKESGREHSACREQEVDMAQAKASKCQAYNIGRMTDHSKPPTCALDKVTTTDPQELEAFEECLREFSIWFKVWDLYQECHAATQEHDNKTTLCNTKQSAFEASSCMYASKHGDFCGCRSRNIEFYNERTAEVKKTETARKADYLAANHIHCLIDVLTNLTMEGKNDTIDRCTNMEIGSGHLSINYGSVPSTEFDCAGSMAKPCEDAWLESEYTSLDWYADAPAAPCNPCLSSTAAPVTEISTSCKALYDGGQNTDGVYTINVVDLDGESTQVSTYCDMANGGWTLVGQVSGWQEMEQTWLRTFHNEAALQARDIPDGWASIPAVDMAVNKATSVRFSNSDVSKYVEWDMDEDRSMESWWNRAAGYEAVYNAVGHVVTVRDQDGRTGQCFQNAYGIAKKINHGGPYPAATLNDIGNTDSDDLCMGVAVTLEGKDGWTNQKWGADAPQTEGDWPNSAIRVPPHVSVWLK